MSFDLSSLPGPVRFSPPAEMTLHGGEPVPAEMDFFVAPPPEIGPLVSGHSTLKAGKNAISPGKRLGIAGAFAGATLAIGFVAAALWMPAEPLPIRIVTLFVAAIVGLVAWFTTRFQHTLTYVGQQGVARYLLSGDRSNLPRAESFPFPRRPNCERQ